MSEEEKSLRERISANLSAILNRIRQLSCCSVQDEDGERKKKEKKWAYAPNELNSSDLPVRPVKWVKGRRKRRARGAGKWGRGTPWPTRNGERMTVEAFEDQSPNLPQKGPVTPVPRIRSRSSTVASSWLSDSPLPSSSSEYAADESARETPLRKGVDKGYYERIKIYQELLRDTADEGDATTEGTQVKLADQGRAKASDGESRASSADTDALLDEMLNETAFARRSPDECPNVFANRSHSSFGSLNSLQREGLLDQLLDITAEAATSPVKAATPAVLAAISHDSLASYGSYDNDSILNQLLDETFLAADGPGKVSQ